MVCAKAIMTTVMMITSQRITVFLLGFFMPHPLSVSANPNMDRFAAFMCEWRNICWRRSNAIERAAAGLAFRVYGVCYFTRKPPRYTQGTVGPRSWLPAETVMLSASVSDPLETCAEITRRTTGRCVAMKHAYDRLRSRSCRVLPKRVERSPALHDTDLVRTTGALKPLGRRVKREAGAPSQSGKVIPALPPQR